MAYTHDGVVLKNVTHNDGKVNKWIHNGEQVFASERLVISNNTMNGEYITNLIRGAIGYNNGMYNRQSLSASTCKFTLAFGSTGASDGYQWFGTPLIDVKGFTKCDVTFTSELVGTTDKVTVRLSSTAPSGYKQTVANIGTGGYNDFAMTGIHTVSSVAKDGKNVTVTLQFSDIEQLSVLFTFYSNWGENANKTKTIQIHEVKIYN